MILGFPGRCCYRSLRFNEQQEGSSATELIQHRGNLLPSDSRREQAINIEDGQQTSLEESSKVLDRRSLRQATRWSTSGRSKRNRRARARERQEHRKESVNCTVSL